MAKDHGTCMFVWECLKTEGKHLGMCMDGFMFGSCCVHEDNKNKVASDKIDTSPDDLDEIDDNNQGVRDYYQQATTERWTTPTTEKPSTPTYINLRLSLIHI